MKKNRLSKIIKTHFVLHTEIKKHSFARLLLIDNDGLGCKITFVSSKICNNAFYAYHVPRSMIRYNVNSNSPTLGSNEENGSLNNR